MRDCSPDGSSVWMDNPLRVGEIVWLGEGDELIKAVARQCVKDGDGYRIGLYLVHNEKRSCQRNVVAGSGKLHFEADDGSTRTVTADIHNISDDGFQVTSPAAVPIGSTARLAGNRYQCIATACYCTPAGEQYLVGFQYFVKPHRKETQNGAAESESPS